MEAKIERNSLLEMAIAKEIASITRTFMAAKLFIPLVATIIVPILICFSGNNKIAAPYFIDGGIILFILIIVFIYFSPRIVMSEHQLDDYFTNLDQERETWKKQAEIYKSQKENISRQSALSISPYPEITNNLQKTLAEVDKLIRNIEQLHKISLSRLSNCYNELYFQCLKVGQENILTEHYKKVTNNEKLEINKQLTDLNELLEICKVEQKNLPEKAEGYKSGLIKLNQAMIDKTTEEISRIRAKEQYTKTYFQKLA